MKRRAHQSSHCCSRLFCSALIDDPRDPPALETQTTSSIPEPDENKSILNPLVASAIRVAFSGNLVGSIRQDILRQENQRPVYGTVRLPDAGQPCGRPGTTDQLLVHFAAEPDKPTSYQWVPPQQERDQPVHPGIPGPDSARDSWMPVLVERLPDTALNGTSSPPASERCPMG